MSIDFGRINSACLGAFGDPYTLRRFQTGESEIITGILSGGSELEGVAPGDGSTIAKLWVSSANIVRPVKGDEISTESTVYKIVDTDEDSANGLSLLLRKDRAII